MYPHHKLDWTASRLEARLAEAPDDAEARVELARVYLSRGLFHGGGEPQLTLALQAARRLIQENPGHTEALVLAGAALVGMDRVELAQKYLDEAVRLDPARADLQFALGAMYRGMGDRHLALRHLETACRAAPSSWEVHLLLGRTLAERAKRTASNRLRERSQYHLVSALKLEPSPELLPALIRDLGQSCLQTGRYAEAEKLFIRLRENPKFTAQARRYLGQVAFGLGKYKNAVQHYRQFLDAHGEDAAVLAQMGAAYLQLGELEKARDFAHRALATDPHHLPARHTLGSTLLEEGQVPEALKVFKETLEEHPDDMTSYVELARSRRKMGDLPWLQRALVAEVSAFDRLPFTGGEGSARSLTRRRIQVLLDELKAAGPSSIGPVLQAIELTDDEGLRFALWEAACTRAMGHVADETSARLREPGRHYSVALARSALAAASALPEPTLTGGLNITADDIQRAAVARRGAAPDLTAHRRALDAEREQARAWQALLLLAIATRRSRSARQLLTAWGTQADPELQIAVAAAQVLCGEADAARVLMRRAQERGAGAMVERLLAQVTPPSLRAEPRAVADSADVHCSSCNRTGADTQHLMAGTRAVLCNICVAEVANARKSQLASDGASCDLCGRTHFESRALYLHHTVHVCADCLDLSLGLLEREEVDRFLASW